MSLQRKSDALLDSVQSWLHTHLDRPAVFLGVTHHGLSFWEAARDALPPGGIQWPYAGG